MRYAVIADIHANLDALQVVQKDIQDQRCTHVVCLGDVVGYGADPKACLDIVRAMNVPTVKGNHDEYIGGDDNPEGFNDAAAEAVAWSRAQLTDADRQWLRDLKYFRLVTNFTIVHATLDGPSRWGYVFDKLEAAASFTYQNTQVCFFGHTHHPMAFVRDSMVKVGLYTKLKVEPGKRYFVNVGSVGQPRDGDARAAYAIYDVPQQMIELRRVAYDIPNQQRKIRAAGLPDRLADRLALGR